MLKKPALNDKQTEELIKVIKQSEILNEAQKAELIRKLTA